MSKSGQYIIGIDLGTTNCTLAYVKREDEDGQIEQLPIPQLTAAGIQGEDLQLPSFLYLPLDEELTSQNLAVEWDKKRSYVVGVHAKNRGSEVANRLVASSKSWLCHTGVDRREKLLPTSCDFEESKMSPVTVCSLFLEHLKEVWNLKFPSAPFNEQQVFVTVPASFDPSAKELVEEAAQSANYPSIILLEEPQAAFYSWLNQKGEEWRKELQVDDQVLVVDIGGGTTDFTLIKVVDQEGDLTLERVAVGSHLLLGGDNIDLSLAYLAKDKLEEGGGAIDEWQLASLQHRCREAKEQLLSDVSLKSIDVTIMGRGSSLIGGSLTASLLRDEVESIVLDGFMPIISATDRAKESKQTGIQQVGLPYAQDPRITAQLAQFLSMSGEGGSETMEQFVHPTAVLFNGGTMKAEALRQRIITVLNNWAEEAGREKVQELSDYELDFAVGQGAVFYGLARTGKAIRIKGGTSRSYYIGVEEAVPPVPGRETPLKAICIVPFGMEEGTERLLEEQQFSLVLGEEASFRFFSHATDALSTGKVTNVGDVVKGWKKELTELPPIETLLKKGKADGKTVRVQLKSKVTELGTLELFCVAEDGREWKLEFARRESESTLALSSV